MCVINFILLTQKLNKPEGLIMGNATVPVIFLGLILLLYVLIPLTTA